MLRNVKRLFAAVLIVACFAGGAPAAEFARIATSSVGGGFYLIGNTIAQLCNSMKNGINYTAVTGGSTKNLISLDKGDVEFGLCQSATIDEAIKGKGAFQSPITGLRWVSAIYPMPCHILVHGNDIKSIADFRGKRIDYGAIGAGIETYCRIILNAYGITDNDVKIDRYGKSESADAIKVGDVDANFWTTTVPNAQVTDMISDKVRLLSMEPEKQAQILKDHPYFSAAVIPGGTYEGYDEDLLTIASIGALVTTDKMSEEMVYQTVKAMYENVDFLKGRLPAYFANFELERALDGCSLEIHPGALRYYKEVGLIE